MAWNDERRTAAMAQAAVGAAAIMMAHHVAGKAARDALFLSRFPATDLPKIILLAGVTGVAAGLLFARILVPRGPAKVLPFALAGSVALHLLEFALISHYRNAVVVFTYLHIVAATTVVLSMFWGMANEGFTPGEAKRLFGRITAGGTVGGIAGGLLAEQVAVRVSVEALFLLLAALHLLAAIVVIILGRLRGPATPEKPTDDDFISTVRGAVRRAPFLKSLGLLVFCITISSGILDFLFKTQVAGAYENGPAMARFFAFFYAGTQTLAFLLQIMVTPAALRRLGLGRTVMATPIALMGGGIVSFWFPMLPVFGIVRGADFALHGSLFRAGYELFFTPVPARAKRAVKTAIDAGCDRMGEVVTAGVIQVFLILGLATAMRPLLMLVTGVAGICIWITARMDQGYLKALEQGLLQRAVDLDEADVRDSTTLSALIRTLPGVRTSKELRSALIGEPPASPARLSMPSDPALARLHSLRSGVEEEVRRAIDEALEYDFVIVPQMIRLLAWDEVTEDARAYLERHLPRVAGQLADVLLDTNVDFSVRRRIPRILAQNPTQRTAEALEQALEDGRFEIRFQSSRALEFLSRSNSGLRFDTARIMARVEKELSVPHSIWESRRLLESRDRHSQAAYLDEVLRDRSNQSLEHVFSLLAIALPKDPLKVAFRALHSQDRLLRGLGLEYLETALPARPFELLRTILEVGPATAPIRQPQAALDALLASHQSILLSLKTPSADADEPDPQPRQARAT